MKIVKLVVFIIGIALINYVGGIPEDSRNLFITHAIFFAPILIDFYPLIKIKSLYFYIVWTIRIIFILGIIVISLNILGIVGVLTINKSLFVTYNNGYLEIIPFKVHIVLYLRIVGIVYVLVFLGILSFEHLFDREHKMNERKNSRKEMNKHVHSK